MKPTVSVLYRKKPRFYFEFVGVATGEVFFRCRGRKLKRFYAKEGRRYGRSNSIRIRKVYANAG